MASPFQSCLESLKIQEKEIKEIGEIQEKIINELLSVYMNTNSFINDLKMGGFKIANLTQPQSLSFTMSEFLTQCNGLNIYEIYKVFHKLSEKYNGLEWLKKINNIIEETKNLDQNKKEVVYDVSDNITKVSEAHQNRYQDWGSSPDVSVFFGRHSELSTLRTWVIDEKCKVVAVIGLRGVGKTKLSLKLAKGGIGKTDPSLKFAHTIQNEFKYVIWRSLLNEPTMKEVLTDLINFLSQNSKNFLESSDNISTLLAHLKSSRCLIILDNFESVLEGGNDRCNYKDGYEDYGVFIQRMAESEHQGCLLMTSREKPPEVANLGGKKRAVRFMELSGLNIVDAQKIFEEIDNFQGSHDDWAELVRFYNGNPLAMELAANHIREVFFGNISDFLREGRPIFDDLFELLNWHFDRLSESEKEILYWLAINRESISLSELKEDIYSIEVKDRLSSILQLLQRRLPLEKSINSFTLQPVLIEYVTGKLIQGVVDEIDSLRFNLFKTHALVKATAKEYIRTVQTNLILKPIASRIPSPTENLRACLEHLRQEDTNSLGYAVGNIINLLVLLEVDITGYDFSNLTISQAFLQGINLCNVDFSYSNFRKVIFSTTLSTVFSAAFSPDGISIATSDASNDVNLWRIEDNQNFLKLKGHGAWVCSIAFSVDGQVMVTGSDDHNVRLWNIKTGSCIGMLQGHSGRVRSVCFGFYDRTVASGSEDRTIKLWNLNDLNDLKCDKTLIGHEERVVCVAISLDGETIASSSRDQTIKLWDFNTGECLKTLRGHIGEVRTVCFSPDNKILASGGNDNTVRLWNIREQTLIRTLEGHTNWVKSIAFNKQGSILVSCSSDQTIKLWDPNTGECLKTLFGHVGGVNTVSFDYQNTRLVSGGYDNSLKIWNIQNGLCLKTWQGYDNSIRSIIFIGKDQSNLIVHDSDNTVKLWNINSEKPTKVLLKYRSEFGTISLSSNGKTIAVSGENQTVNLWDISTGKCLRKLHNHIGIIGSLAFSPDSRLLAAGNNYGLIKIWDIYTGQCLQELNGHKGWIWQLSFDMNQEIIASCSSDNTVKLWDINTGELLKTLEGHTRWVRSALFANAENIVLSASDDSTIRIWDAESGKCKNILQGHSSGIRQISLSSDGVTLASAGLDQTVKLWNIDTGELLYSLKGHNDVVWTVAFSPNGLILVSGGSDKTIRLWDVRTGECCKTLENPRIYENMNITGSQGLTEDQQVMLKSLGATSTI